MALCIQYCFYMHYKENIPIKALSLSLAIISCESISPLLSPETTKHNACYQRAMPYVPCDSIKPASKQSPLVQLSNIPALYYQQNEHFHITNNTHCSIIELTHCLISLLVKQICE